MHPFTRILHCTNCGLPGHLFRNCASPVTSYGLIAVRYTEDAYCTSMFSRAPIIPNGYASLQVLMIQRRHTLAFVEFIRGKYSTHDDTYLCLLLEGMTQDEHRMMQTMEFDEMWHIVWGESSERRSHRNDYDTSERRYSVIRERLQELIRTHPTAWTEPEWGFPKGRRNPYETDMNCAAREFQEETGLHGGDYAILQNVQPISESFYGCNQVHYCHIYYLAICRSTTEVGMHLESRCMVREVRDIAWCTMEEAIARIRPDNVEKREVLLKAGKIFKHYHPVSIGRGV